VNFFLLLHYGQKQQQAAALHLQFSSVAVLIVYPPTSHSQLNDHNQVCDDILVSTIQ